MSLCGKSTKQIADELRVEILTMSDEDLFYFKHAVHGGEAKTEPLESVPEFINRLARQHIENMPF